MDESFPDGGLIEDGIIFLVGDYFLVEVAVIQKLHYNAELW